MLGHEDKTALKNASNSHPLMIESRRRLEELHLDIWSYLQESIEKNKELPALVCAQTDRTYTYEDVNRGSSNWASILSSLSNDSRPPPVAFLSPNTIESIILVLGSLRAGSTLHMINVNHPLDVVKGIVENSEAHIIITDVSVSEIVKTVVEKIGRKFHIFTSGINETEERSVERIIKDTTIPSFEQKKVDPESAAFVFFSSGTTGPPKGILKSHKSLVNLTYIIKEDYDGIIGDENPASQSSHLVIGACPFEVNHVFYFTSICTGSKAIVIRSMDPDKILSATKKYESVTLYARSNLLDHFSRMEDPLEYLGSIKQICNIGSTVSSTTMLKLRERLGENIIIKNIYGSTESGVIGYSLNPAEPSHFDLDPSTEVRIVDPKTKEDLGPNQVGEVYARIQGSMIGYFKNPEATEETLDSEGWVHTGDSAYFTEDKHLCFFDRIKDVIHVHGKMVSPTDIEKVMVTHPSVLEVGVTGFPDATAGELPVAFVVKANQEVSEEELIAFTNELIAKSEQRVNRVQFISALPRNHMGKIERKRLRQLREDLKYNMQPGGI